VQLFAATREEFAFSSDLTDELHGWEAGAQLNWDIFDGYLTKGRVQEAEGLRKRALEELIEAERTVNSTYARRIRHSSKRARSCAHRKKFRNRRRNRCGSPRPRADAGTATQLDVLNAQTALTEARSTQTQALHDFAVARAQLERAIGPTISKATKASAVAK